MIAELIIYHLGYTDVWYAHPGPFRRRYWPWFFRRVFVGIRTGPPGEDLICVEECETEEQADRALSPAGYTILHAAILAWMKRSRLRGAL